MNNAEIISRIKAAEPELRPLGISALYLFGSYARGDAGEDSDIDLFVDPDPQARFGFDQFMDVYDVLKRTLPNTEIQYGTRDGLSKYVRNTVEREAIRVL
jgi:predicted nucleotidyltransferase